jgi:hypothetical protein
MAMVFRRKLRCGSIPSIARIWLALCFIVATIDSARAKIVLTDDQLDMVNAGAETLQLSLSAQATGSKSSTSTIGNTHESAANLLEVTASKPSVVPVELFFGNGTATAAGDTPTCSASLVFEGPSLKLLNLATETRTTTSAICSCAIFVVAPRP